MNKDITIIIEELEERARRKRKNDVANAQAIFDGYQQACDDIRCQAADWMPMPEPFKPGN